MGKQTETAKSRIRCPTKTPQLIPIAITNRNDTSYSKRLRLWASLDEAQLARIKQSKQQEATTTAALSLCKGVSICTEGSPAAPRTPSLPGMPEFPLAPVSKGFCISVNRHLSMLEQLIASAGDDLKGQ
ncbi:unnamed protein product [Schistocephalus solidus]|uniref:Uncharacterized protein n=1 Tax=Schistocephalus solidus TaxID=70667 RepID=A0A183TGR3_SCHSO|nr:unnamed protein product [Schistocephalus solidus]